MRVGIIGRGHFATVIAVCLAEHHVIAQFDYAPPMTRAGQKPGVSEPGMLDLLARVGDRVDSYDDVDHLAAADVIWIAYDVPLDAEGTPVIDEIIARIVRLHGDIPQHVPCLVSCQWPVGTLAKLEALLPSRRFIYVLENVRVGKAVTDFQQQDTWLCGWRQPLPSVVADFVRATGKTILPMSPESAEMSKHALNAFMALQIAFINEIDRVCQAVGAKSEDVSRALLSDARVSPEAYLKPGGPFGGGSLKRDLLVLEALANRHALTIPILQSILLSNEG